MTRTASIAALVVSLIAASSPAVQAQYNAYGYHHRSTPIGDAFSGLSDLFNSEANLRRATADAAKTWVAVAAAEEDLRYQVKEQYYQEQQLKIEYRTAKREDKLSRQAAKAASEELAAQDLWQNARRGVVNWPAALMRPEFSASMSLVESILRSWSPNDPTADAYRSSLATEAGVLRARIANNPKIPFHAREQAVDTLKRLQLLATVDASRTGGQQLAMNNAF